jgi:tRNA(Ile)-lysidine synthase
MLLQSFHQHLQTQFPFLSSSQKILLAVSGGIDSTVLANLFLQSGYDFTVAHCNFQLREDESIRDELFVRELAKKYNKEILVKRFNTSKYAADKKISTQEAARELRYAWFDEIKGEHFLCTAHTADDNIETMLMFLFRGTGIHGLTGIMPFDKKRKIIRPLLFASRKDIVEYANEQNINWVEDSSNAASKYTRNFLRHRVIARVEEHYPSVKENLLENIKRFAEIEQLYTQAIELHKSKLLKYKGNEIHIPVLKLQQAKPLNSILWEIVKEFNFHTHQLTEIKKLFTANNSSYVQSSTHRIIKNRNWLIIAPNKNERSEFILIEENDKQVTFENGVLSFEKLAVSDHALSSAKTIAQLNAAEIQFPLLLRKWKKGDYFYPLGMKKKKKVSRFFIDEKLSATEKENVWVIEMNKKIIWIIGHRIDDRFKISGSTNDILKINFAAAHN